MDLFICGICQKEFNDIDTFVEHKKTLNTFGCKHCEALFHTCEEVAHHIGKEHLGAMCSDDYEVSQDIQLNSQLINNSCDMQVTSMTVERLGDVALVPDEDGNIMLMGNIQIIQPDDAVTLESLPGEELTLDGDVHTFLTLQPDPQLCSSVTSLGDVPSETTSCPTPIVALKNPLTTSEANVPAGHVLPGIYACSLCHCFSMTVGDIKKHLQVVHNKCMQKFGQEALKFFKKLQPLPPSGVSQVIAGGENQEPDVLSEDTLRILPATKSDNDCNAKTTTVHLYVDTVKEMSGMEVVSSKRKRGRPRKNEKGKARDQPQQNENNELEVEPVLQQPPQPGPDGIYYCNHCNKGFSKERHLLRHKCHRSGDYFYMSQCDNAEDKTQFDNADHNSNDDEDDLFVDMDTSRDFKVYMSIDRPPWSRGARRSRKGREYQRRIRNHRGTRSIAAVNNQVVDAKDSNDGTCSEAKQKVATVILEDGENAKGLAKESDGKVKVNWREDPQHIPVFGSEEERVAFEERLNGIDLSCVDLLHTRHKVSQDIDPSRVTKLTGRDCSELLMFSCKVCKKVFKSLSHMRLHCLIHTDQKPFQCPHCNLRFNAKGNLYTHMRKHTGNVFKCSVCHFKSCNRSHMAEHEATHSNVRHRCKLCQNDYNTLKSLTNHVRKYHAGPAGCDYLATFLGRTRPSMAILHVCQVCNRKFKKKIDRDRHLFVHDVGDSRIVLRCALCDYTTVRRSYLVNHHRKHRVVYVCCICDDLFLSSIRLQQHLQEHLNASEKVEVRPVAGIQNLTVDEEEDKPSSRHDPPVARNDVTLVSSLHSSETQALPQAGALPTSAPEDLHQAVLQNDTLDTLLNNSINKSWYLPEPDGSVALSQYVNLPEELTEQQDKNTEKIKDDETSGILQNDVLASKNGPKFASMLSCNYKPLSVLLYSKIRETFGQAECEICGRFFHGNFDLEPHILTHANSKCFKCDHCSYSSASKDNLRRHCQTVHESHTLSCRFCSFSTTSRASLRNHRQQHVATLDECPFCRKLFQNPQTLRLHVLARHPKSDKLQVAKITNPTRRMVGRLGRRSYKCPYCDRVFRRSSTDLQKHIWIHQGVKPFRCPLCPHACRSRNNLNVHMLRHTAEKPHLCDECGKSYKSKTALRSHIRIHSEDSVYYCSQCKYSSPHKCHFKRHMETHEVVRKYFCQHCDYSSSTVGYMKLHYTRKHKGSTFDDSTSAEIHLNMETQDRVYKCLNCDDIFEDLHYMKQHLKVGHDITAGSLRVEATVKSDVREDCDAVVVQNMVDQVQPVEHGESRPTSEEMPTNNQESRAVDLQTGGVDERTASAVDIIRQIIERGGLESPVTLQSVDVGSLVGMDPETIVVQDEQGVLLGDGQYVIQYVARPPVDETEMAVRSVDETVQESLVAIDQCDPTLS